MGKPGGKAGGGGGKKPPNTPSKPGDKRFYPTKQKKGGMEQWIPEAKALMLKVRTIAKETSKESRSGSVKSLTCLFCRKSGHMMSRCPENKGKGKKPQKICYKCGGNDHSVWDCKVEASELGEDAGKFAFAACFVCGEKGHISRECPQNAKGIYVNGGCCKQCGGKDHLIKDCPKLPEHRRGPKPGKEDGALPADYSGRRYPAAVAPGDVDKKSHMTFGGEDLEDDFNDNLSDTEQVEQDPNDGGETLQKPQNQSKSKGKTKTAPKVVQF